MNYLSNLGLGLHYFRQLCSLLVLDHHVAGVQKQPFSAFINQLYQEAASDGNDCVAVEWSLTLLALEFNLKLGLLEIIQ